MWEAFQWGKQQFWDPAMGFEGKMGALKRKIQVLICRKEDVMVQVQDAQLHPSKKRKTEVDNWQSNVQKLKHEFECFEQEVQQSSNRVIIQLSGRADEILRQVEDLLEQGKFPEGIFLDVNEENVHPLVTTNVKGQAFLRNLTKVLEYLDKAEVYSIGIYGMGGVGKTTLAMHIHDDLLKHSRFSGNVYWVTVSHDSTIAIAKLQNDIAKILGLDLSSENDAIKRAAKLYRSLKRKSFVLILDDVWIDFDVGKVGIPLEEGGGKLIITSRSVEVCNIIGCKKIVNVATLSPEESWELFLEKLDYDGDLPKEIEETAKNMKNKCDGLPLGLITVAASMRGVNNVVEWREAFKELVRMELDCMNDKVFPILRYSYNRLRDPRVPLQKCFLYCCLYPEDYKIKRDELIRLFIVDEFLEIAEFNQGHYVLNKLEKACLLESVEDYDKEICVRMHDLVREMALKIGRDEFKWMSKAGAQLSEIPGEKEWSEDLDKVSLMNNYITEISVPLSDERPKLTTLLLQRNDFLSQIVDNFFVQMSGLRVLDLSYTWIEKLPSSVSNLESLSMLLLRCCRELKFVPPLDKLKKLIELDLHCTGIKEVPQGLESLVNLRFLDMTKVEECEIKQPAVDIIALLLNLQSLLIPFEVRVEDLLQMKHLEVFHGGFVDVCSFNKFVKARKKLTVFDIGLDSKESFTGWPYGTGKGKRVKLNGLVVTGDNVEMLCCDEIEVKEERDVIFLPLDTQELEITDSEFRTSSNSFLDAIPSLIRSKDLRGIKISDCKGMEFVMRLSNCRSKIRGDWSCCPLQYLERLELQYLKEFTGLCKLELREALPPVGTFSHLRCLHVWQCHRMKKLIPRWLLQYLLNLTNIHVESCGEMEEIITEDEEEQFNQWGSSASSSSSSSIQSRSIDNEGEVILPKLKVLKVGYLPKLENIYKGRMSCNSIKKIGVFECPKVKRLPLTLPLQNGQPSAPLALEEIVMKNKEEWESLEWEDPQYKNLLHPFFREDMIRWDTDKTFSRSM